MKILEGEKIEYKSYVTSQLIKEVIAFANTNGGKIYIGIEDDLSIVGIENYDETLLQVTNMIRDLIKPDLTMFVSYQDVHFDELVVLEIEVQRGVHRPYYISKNGLKPSGVYIRSGSSSIPCSESRIREMIKEDDGDSFEAMRSFSQYLSFHYLESELSKRSMEINEYTFYNFKIKNQDQLYTNLGYLLSDQCPFDLKVIQYSTNQLDQIQDRHIYGGSLLQSLNETYHYLEGINHLHSTFSGLERNDQYDYPPVALREALLNCVVHRDYSLKGSTKITVYPDRVEFLTLGGLYNGITTNDIIAGASVCRNEDLAKLFYRMNLIEGFGTGLKKIFEAYQNTNKHPLLEITDHVFKITLFNINTEYSNPIHIDPYQGKMVCESTDEYQVITNYLGNHYFITRNDIENLLHTSQATSNRIIRKMLENEEIVKVGKGKNTRYMKK